MNASCGVVFVGRSNRAKQSDTFPRLSRALALRGYPVRWFESGRTAAVYRMNARMTRVAPAIAASTGRRHRLHRRIIRILFKTLIALGEKERWDFLRAAIVSPPVAAARELERFIDGLPMERVHIIAQSAGAISATKIASNPKISTICCFGYPFKHPDNPAESYRTRHLPAVTKPLLIIQGTADEYGPASPDLRSVLPPHARLIAIDCDHDYANLSDAMVEQVLAALRDLIEVP